MKNMQMTKLKNSIKPGDLFELGDHRIICGDAQDKNIVKKLLRDNKIILLCCDPPYGINYTNSKASFNQKISCNKEIANDELVSKQTYEKFSKDWLEPIIPYYAKQNAVYIFNSDKMVFSLREAMIQSGYKISQLLIWVKNAPVLGRLDYLPMHELIMYGWYGRHKFRKAKDKSVIYCPRPQKSKLHPTMKPVSLIRQLILNSSKVGDIVYDPFGGSGTTLLASEQTKRKCMMIELDPEYCQVIIDRFEKLTGQSAKKLKP